MLVGEMAFSTSFSWNFGSKVVITSQMQCWRF